MISQISAAEKIAHQHLIPQSEAMPDEDPEVQRLGYLLRSPGFFRAWLDSLPPDAIVGQAHRPTRCPLARFLSEEMRVQCWVFGSTIHVVGFGWATIARQFRWVERFVELSDATYPPPPCLDIYWTADSTPINAETAIRLLELSESDIRGHALAIRA